MKKKALLMTMATGITLILFGSLLNNNLVLSKEEKEASPVEVTNFPLDEEGNLRVAEMNKEQYVFFSYRYNTTLKCYTSPTDYYAYATSDPHTNWYFAKNYTVDTTSFNSGTASTLLFELELYAHPQPCNWGGFVRVIIGGSIYELNTPSIGQYQLICGSIPKGEISEVSVYIRSDCTSYKYKISHTKFNLYYVYDNTELTPEDFGVEALYLKELVLASDDTVVLNRDPTQTVTNFEDSVKTYEFAEKMVLSHIEFIYGHPEILVYAEV